MLLGLPVRVASFVLNPAAYRQVLAIWFFPNALTIADTGMCKLWRTCVYGCGDSRLAPYNPNLAWKITTESASYDLRILALADDGQGHREITVATGRILGAWNGGLMRHFQPQRVESSSSVGVRETASMRVVASGVEARFEMEVVTSSGRAAAVKFLIRRDVVEVWMRDCQCGVLNREVLRDWLSAPGLPLVADDVLFSFDTMVDSLGRVALSLPGVLVWTLAPMALAELRKRV